MNDAVIETGPFDIAICAATVSDYDQKRSQTNKKSSIGKYNFWN